MVIRVQLTVRFRVIPVKTQEDVNHPVIVVGTIVAPQAPHAVRRESMTNTISKTTSVKRNTLKNQKMYSSFQYKL